MSLMLLTSFFFAKRHPGEAANYSGTEDGDALGSTTPPHPTFRSLANVSIIVVPPFIEGGLTDRTLNDVFQVCIGSETNNIISIGGPCAPHDRHHEITSRRNPST